LHEVAGPSKFFAFWAFHFGPLREGHGLKQSTRRAEMPGGEAKEWNGQPAVGYSLPCSGFPVVRRQAEMTHAKKLLKAPFFNLEFIL